MNIKNTRRVSVFLVALLCLAAAGCRDAYTESMSASAKVSDTIGVAIGAVRDLTTNGTITKEERNEYLEYLGDATTVNTEFRQAARNVHRSGAKGAAAYLVAANEALTAFDNLNKKHVLRVKNPEAQATLNNVVQAIRTAVNGIGLAISAAKGQ